MISNERPSPFRPRSPKPYQSSFPPRPPVQENTISSGEVQVERKKFVFQLKENPRGRFMRIIEDAAGKSNSIIVPYSGLEDFVKTLADTIKAAPNLPSENSSQQ
jgi:hypothetical protein